MSLNVALQMDHPETINIVKDSTFVLGLEAQTRGYNLHYYSPDTLRLENGTVKALCAPLALRKEDGNHFTLGEFKETDLSDFDIILMRQNFTNPLAYDASTHILDQLENKTLVLNNPAGVRNAPEKLFITHYPDLTPPTLISRNLSDIKRFQKAHGDIIMKPLNGFGGLDIYHIKSEDNNLKAVYDMMCRLHETPFVAQRYIPEVRQGDKRIIVLEGEPIGAVMRVPLPDSARANLAAGAKPQKTDITDHERKMCAALKPALIERGLVLVGVDVIGQYVTEVNPKSPTGIQEINRFNDTALEKPIWDAFEARFSQFRKKAA